MKVTRAENRLIWALRDMVIQHCHADKDELYDSSFLSSDCEVIRTLAEYGHMQLVDAPEFGRWVSARMVEQGQTPNAFGDDVIGDRS